MRGTFADKEKKKEKKKAKTVEQTATTVNKKPGQVRWAKVHILLYIRQFYLNLHPSSFLHHYPKYVNICWLIFRVLCINNTIDFIFI